MSLQHINRFATPRILHFGILRFVVMLLVVLSIESGLLASKVQAQNSAEMSAVYGRGVHAFFANRMADAEQLFSQVIQAGSTDPRVFYFRAMTRLRTGRSYEAEEDMKIGAAYEARDPGSRHSIGKALQRVQGQGRRTLERFRREGRLNRVQQRRQQSLLRYEQLDQRAPHVLRSKPPVLQEQSSGPSMQLSVPTTSPLEANAAVAAPANSAQPAPEPALTAEGDNLFGDPAPNPMKSADEPTETESDSTDDFFGDPAPTEPTLSEPITEKPAIEEPVAGDEDPFADAAEIEETPASNPDPPMAEEAAAAEEEFFEPTAEGDLFGDTGTEEETTEETPDESDSSEPPANTEEPAEEDPFGEEPAEEAAEPEASEAEEAEPMEESSESTEEETPQAEEDEDLFGDF